MKRKVEVLHTDSQGRVTESVAHCKKCIYWERKEPYGTIICERGDCHRYPRPDNKDENDWCGEFKCEQ